MIRKLITAAIIICIISVLVIAVPKNDISFNGFYFDTYITCSISNVKGSIDDDYINVISRLHSELSAYDKDARVFEINNGSEYDSESDVHISALLDGYKSFEREFGLGITPFCGSLTYLWNVTSDDPSLPAEADIENALKNVYPSSEYNGNITHGALLDFGSGAKGYVCDIMLETAACDKAEEIVFSAGSSSLVMSSKNKLFTTKMINPVNENSPVLFQSGNAFISTSGGYERFFEIDGKKYSHIMDVESGYPAETDIASVTVILPCEKGNGLTSDLLSTLLYAKGTSELDKYADICDELYSDYGIIAITNNGEIISKGTVTLL